jgi:hypothetical protein
MEKLIRYYWYQDDEMFTFPQCTCNYYRRNKYAGLNVRFIIPPPSRCILSLTQVLSIGFGWKPADSVWSDKTKTIEDLD